MLLCEALGLYEFPPVTFDFEGRLERRHGAEVRRCEAMRRVEKRVGQQMCSRNPGAVRDGLSNVLYWGWAQRPGRQRNRVSAFRDRIQPNDPRLVRFMNFVHSTPRTSQSAAERLHALKQLKLPQFSQVSFTTKILMFLDPNRFAVPDLKIARVAKRCGFPFMQELKIYTGIPITRAKRRRSASSNGYPCKISCTVAPAASMLRMCSTAMRVPRMMDFRPKISGVCSCALE